MKNAEIRSELQKRRIRYWELADALGVSPATLSVKLRHELPVEERERVLRVLQSIGGGADGEEN